MNKFQEQEQLKNIQMFDKAIVLDGIPRWKTNNSIPPKDILQAWEEAGLPFDYNKAISTQDKEIDQELSEYRERMKNHVYSDEEIYEMQAAFGAGATVVDAVTGQKILL